MKIAILGNSHVAALKLGLTEAVKSNNHVSKADITFFAVPGAKFERFDIQDGKLVSKNAEAIKMLKRTSGGYDHIDPKRFDLFILHGLQLQFTYRLIRNKFVSAQAADLCMPSIIRSTLCFSFYQKLQSIADQPILLSPSPLKAENAPHKDVFKTPVSNPALDYDRFIKALENQLERDIDGVIAQPAASRTTNMTTKLEFSEGSARLLQPGRIHGDEDFCHMNSDYGTLWWHELETKLDDILTVASKGGCGTRPPTDYPSACAALMAAPASRACSGVKS